jgi:DNA-binding HxlR family transcriptional regulator
MLPAMDHPYESFCSVARAADLLGERWTLLIVREALMGTTRFADFQRGIPQISRTMLATRLRTLVDAGVLSKATTPAGPTYALTASGAELLAVVEALGRWGQRWLPRHASDAEEAADEVLWDMRRRARPDRLPGEPVVLRVALADGVFRDPTRFLLLRKTEVSLCAHNPGFPELTLRGPPSALVRWWRGDAELARSGLELEGSATLRRAFPGWFERYLFAGIAAVDRVSRGDRSS